MNTVQRLPNIREPVDAILGAPYSQFDCWALVRHLLLAGLGLDIINNPEEAARELREIWAQGDPRDPQQLLQPWDFLIFITRGMVTSHLGLVVDPMTFVHTLNPEEGHGGGVCVDRFTSRLYRPRLFQIARLRMLM